jgi:hypothetical protein
MKRIMDSHKDEFDWSKPSNGPVTNRFMHAMCEEFYISPVTEITEPEYDDVSLARKRFGLDSLQLVRLQGGSGEQNGSTSKAEESGASTRIPSLSAKKPLGSGLRH